MANNNLLSNRAKLQRHLDELLANIETTPRTDDFAADLNILSYDISQLRAQVEHYDRLIEDSDDLFSSFTVTASNGGSEQTWVVCKDQAVLNDATGDLALTERSPLGQRVLVSAETGEPFEFEGTQWVVL